jgi:predicted PurR-regulated permease PerM
MRADIMPWTVRGMGLAVGVALVVGLIALGVAAASVLLLLFLAILLGSALEPFVGGIRDRLPLGRGATILIVYLAFFVTVIGLALVVVPAAIGQGQTILARLPAFFDRVQDWAATLRPAALSHSIIALVDSGRGAIAVKPPDPNEVVQVGTIAASAAITLATLLTLVFFWLVEHARLQRYLLAYIPADGRAGARQAWNEIESRLGLWVRGQLTLMGAMGLATGIAYTLLGLPGALLLALIAALMEAIPIVGPLLGAIPAILVAATVSPQLAVVVAGVYIVLQLVEGSVLVPIVMRNTIGISPLLVLLSLLVGGAAGGLVGAFLAVPVAASVEIALSRLQAREVPVAEDPAAIETPDEEEIDADGDSLPDSRDGAGPAVSAPVSPVP